MLTNVVQTTVAPRRGRKKAVVSANSKDGGCAEHLYTLTKTPKNNSAQMFVRAAIIFGNLLKRPLEFLRRREASTIS